MILGNTQLSGTYSAHIRLLAYYCSYLKQCVLEPNLAEILRPMLSVLTRSNLEQKHVKMTLVNGLNFEACFYQPLHFPF